MKQVFGVIQVEIHNLAEKHIFFLEQTGDEGPDSVTGDFFSATRFHSEEIMNEEFFRLVRGMYGSCATKETLPAFAKMLKTKIIDTLPMFPTGTLINLKQIRVSLDSPTDIQSAEVDTRVFVFHYLPDVDGVAVVVPMPF